MTDITLDDVCTTLTTAGYDVTKNPQEAKPPGRICVVYDFSIEPEDISGTSYYKYHTITLDWVINDPDTISVDVAKLMGVIGKQYVGVYGFRMKNARAKRLGTQYRVFLPLTWTTFQTIDA